jgi:hypothetical protein
MLMLVSLGAILLAFYTTSTSNNCITFDVIDRFLCAHGVLSAAASKSSAAAVVVMTSKTSTIKLTKMPHNHHHHHHHHQEYASTKFSRLRILDGRPILSLNLDGYVSMV